jgi:hypothetical protein
MIVESGSLVHPSARQKFFPCQVLPADPRGSCQLALRYCNDQQRRMQVCTTARARGTVDGMQPLSNTEAYSLSVLSIACISVLVNAWRSDGEPLFASLAIGGVAFAFTYALIPWTGDVFIKRGYKGKDLSKKNPIEL